MKTRCSFLEAKDKNHIQKLHEARQRDCTAWNITRAYTQFVSTRELIKVLESVHGAVFYPKEESS